MLKKANIGGALSSNWAKCITLGALVCGAGWFYAKAQKPVSMPEAVVTASAPVVTPLIEAAPSLMAEKSDSFTAAEPVSLRRVEMKRLELARSQWKVAEMAKRAKKAKRLARLKKRTAQKTASVTPYKKATAAEVLKAFAAFADPASRMVQVSAPQSPIDRLVEKGFEETGLVVENIQTPVPAEKAPEKKLVEIVVPQEPRINLLIAELQRDKFTQLREPLAKMQAEPLAISEPPVAILPSIAEAEKEIESETDRPQLAAMSILPSSGLDDGARENREPASEPTAKEEGPTLVRPTPSPEKIISAIPSENEIVTPVEANPVPVTPTIQTTQIPSVPWTKPTLVAAAPSIPQPTQETKNDEPAPEEKQAQKANKLLADARSAINAKSVVRAEPELVQPTERLYGKFSVEASLLDHLERTKGHIELHIEPLDRKDRTSIDTNPVMEPSEEGERPRQFTYTAEDGEEGFKPFEEEAERLPSKFNLVARFYRGDSSMFEATVPYPQALKSTSRENLRFHVTQAEYDYYVKFVRNVPSSSLLLTIPLFEGGAANYQGPSHIEGAIARVVNFPEWGTFRSDAQGTIRIPKVPTQSELLLHVTSPKYFETEKVIPTFNTDVHDPVYLIAHDKVEAISDFTRSPQDPNKGLLMGRVFDPQKHTPKKGVEVNLVARRTGALYFGENGGFPDKMLPETTARGDFALFNINPMVRSLLHPHSLFKEIPYLVNLKKGMGHYVEFGRGQTRSLRGNLWDPFNKIHPIARIKMVGSLEGMVEGHKGEVFSNAHGDFVIPDIDLPRGQITLEVEAQNYPKTWHTLSWDPREINRKYQISLAEDEITVESVKKYFSMGSLESNKGSLLSWAEPPLLDGRRGCISLHLEDADGKPVDSKSGPYAWGPDAEDSGEPCVKGERPRFAYYNLAPGQYLLNWVEITRSGSKPKKNTFRSHVLYVGADRQTITVN